MIRRLIIVFGLISIGAVNGQIPFDRILEKEELVNYLRQDMVNTILSHDTLIDHLKENLNQRFYFNWKNFKNSFDNYKNSYPTQQKKHQKLSNYHSSRYAANAQWILPYTNLLNEEVTAYELRHVARQQKSQDMALIHFYNNRQSNHINYFTEQVLSLNNAFLAEKYDDEGNGVYEVYRAGRRIHNWLFCHAAYMSDPTYTIEKQSLLIRTFLHHGAQLYKRLPVYRPGNHHTKGLVALFEISTILTDFIDSEKWQKHAIKGLTEHIRQEINSDGFQFERSVHYHKGDIENYFRVYQLAKRTQTKLPVEFTQAFRKMFDALIILAQPNKTLPVLQDDTDKPFSEHNKMGDVFYLASVMFDKPEYTYFSSKKPSSIFYWLMNASDVNLNLEKKSAPQLLSAELEQTGYYVMRDGWDDSSLQMVISAGLSDVKPDHQHGDMLGITAFGFGTALLPNYQVAYKYPDFKFWKNSWAKNVALVDSQLQGRQWIANRGGSGFGKWGLLPNPIVHKWIKNVNFDYLAAAHDGFNNLGINYTREVIFIKGKYWLVTDSFSGEGQHTFQQIWQGKFEIDSEKQVHRSIAKKGQFFISQLGEHSYTYKKNQLRDKHNLVFSSIAENSFIFNTLLYPTVDKNPNKLHVLPKDFESDSQTILKAGKNYLLINMSVINIAGQELKMPGSYKFYLEKDITQVRLTLLHPESITYNRRALSSDTFSKGVWKPGEQIVVNL